MQVTFCSVLVEDQDRALAFYCGKLGFTVQHDIPMGPFRWLTVVSPDGVAGAELLLEPLGFEPARVFQQALYAAGKPATAFITTDLRGEYARLKERGVVFRGEPANLGTISAVLFEDTCGNLINLVQPKG